jgi:hypothetical protein
MLGFIGVLLRDRPDDEGTEERTGCSHPRCPSPLRDRPDDEGTEDFSCRPSPGLQLRDRPDDEELRKVEGPPQL